MSGLGSTLNSKGNCSGLTIDLGLEVSDSKLDIPDLLFFVSIIFLRKSVAVLIFFVEAIELAKFTLKLLDICLNCRFRIWVGTFFEALFQSFNLDCKIIGLLLVSSSISLCSKLIDRRLLLSVLLILAQGLDDSSVENCKLILSLLELFFELLNLGVLNLTATTQSSEESSNTGGLNEGHTGNRLSVELDSSDLLDSDA